MAAIRTKHILRERQYNGGKAWRITFRFGVMSALVFFLLIFPIFAPVFSAEIRPLLYASGWVAFAFALAIGALQGYFLTRNKDVDTVSKAVPFINEGEMLADRVWERLVGLRKISIIRKRYLDGLSDIEDPVPGASEDQNDFKCKFKKLFKAALNLNLIPDGCTVEDFYEAAVRELGEENTEEPDNSGVSRSELSSE